MGQAKPISRIARDEPLPPRDTTRWVPSRKAAVVRAIRGGVIDRVDACARYMISNEELALWERAIDAAGTAGLRVTRVQIYREVFEAEWSNDIKVISPTR